MIVKQKQFLPKLFFETFFYSFYNTLDFFKKCYNLGNENIKNCVKVQLIFQFELFTNYVCKQILLIQ